jgi:hypothetical protein
MKQEDRDSRFRSLQRARSPVIRRALVKTCRTFDNLEAYTCLTARDREDFLWYRDLFVKTLLAIDGRITRGELVPLDLEDFPSSLHLPNYTMRAALYIGSFDPFQMTHLAMALQYLAEPESTAPVVFVIPEGADNPDKPQKSDYQYRFDLLRMQLSDNFYPLVVPLNLGREVDTIGIVSRFIDFFPCGKVAVTHLLGSDALPTAARMLPEDLRIWRRHAKEKQVDLTYQSHIVKRMSGPEPEPWLKVLRDQGVEARLDTSAIEAPSSTDFRSNRTFSIVFPTRAVMAHMEVLFRYGLNKNRD